MPDPIDLDVVRDVATKVYARAGDGVSRDVAKAYGEYLTLLADRIEKARSQPVRRAKEVA